MDNEYEWRKVLVVKLELKIYKNARGKRSKDGIMVRMGIDHIRDDSNSLLQAAHNIRI